MAVLATLSCPTIETVKKVTIFCASYKFFFSILKLVRIGRNDVANSLQKLKKINSKKMKEFETDSTRN